MTTECLICSRQQDSSGFIYQNDLWTVRHSNETNILGYVLIEARRHFLDLSESTDSECESYGKMLKQVCLAVHKLLPAHRIYTFTLAEKVPHFHVHVIPRTDHLPRAYRGRGIMSYPLAPTADPALVSEFSARLARMLNKTPIATF